MTTLGLFGALAAAYGTFAALAVRFLYPAKPAPTRWLFVTEVARMKPGDSLAYTTPAGATVAIARQGTAADASAFIALSNVCPHLGCKVHWEAQKNRFFCPCHNGVFDPNGRGIGGPPGEAGQSLPRYPLKVDNALLFINVPLDTLAAVNGGGGTWQGSTRRRA